MAAFGPLPHPLPPAPALRDSHSDRPPARCRDSDEHARTREEAAAPGPRSAGRSARPPRPRLRLRPGGSQGRARGGRRGIGLRARDRGRGHPRQPRAPHSHVVEAEQVIAREGPERSHCAAAAEAGLGDPRARPAGSCPARGCRGGGAENCFRATSCSATTTATRLSLAAASGIAGSFL